MFRLLRRAALASAVTLALSLTVGVPAASAGPAQLDVPVVFVHGFYNDTCPSGLNVTSAMFGPLLDLTVTGWTGDLDVVSYYACDQGGSRIGSDTVNTPIQTIAAQLAAYIFATYSSRGQEVDIVAHSMGGLVARAAIEYTASHVSGFPPYLLVKRVVTFSTPFAGVGPATINAVPGLAGTYQAAQVLAGSSFLQSFERAGAAPAGNGPDWLTIGSSGGCDLVPGASAVALAGAAFQVLYTGCWSHVQYLLNFTLTRSFGAILNGTPTLAYSPIELMRIFLTM